MTPELNRKLTWVAGVVAAATTFAAVTAGHLDYAIGMVLGATGLAAGLSLGFAIRRWRGDH